MEAKIEIFKIGEHTDASENTKKWTAEDLELIVSKYNNQPKGDEYIAPVILGHELYDGKPAYAWVKSLSFDGEKLFADIYQVTDELQEWVQAGKYKSVSIALFEDWLLMHIAALGAEPPAVRGLSPISFGAKKKYTIYNVGSPVIEFVNSEAEKTKKENNNQQFNNKQKKNIMTKDELISELQNYMQTKYNADEAGELISLMKDWLEELEGNDKDEDIEKDETKEEGEAIPFEEVEATPKEPATYSAKSGRSKDVQNFQANARYSKLEKKVLAMEDEKYFSKMLSEGRILQKQVPTIQKILNAFRENKEYSNQFSVGKQSEDVENMFKEFISGLPKQVEFSDFASTPEGKKEIDNVKLIREYAQKRKAGK